MVGISVIKAALKGLKVISSTPLVNKSVTAFKDAITPALGMYFGSGHEVVRAVKAVPAKAVHKLLPVVLTELDGLTEGELGVLLEGDYTNPKFVKDIVHIASHKLQKTLSPESISELKPILLEIFNADSWISSIIKASTEDEAQQNLPELLKSLDKLTEKNWADVLDLADYAYHNNTVQPKHVYGLIQALDKLGDYLSSHSLGYLKSVLGAILVDDKYVSGIIEAFDDNVTQEMAPVLIHSLAKLSQKEMSILVGEEKGDLKSYQAIATKLKDVKGIVKADNIESVKPIIKAIFGEEAAVSKVVDHMNGKAFEQAVHMFDVAEKMSYGIKSGFNNLLTKITDFGGYNSHDDAHYDSKGVLHDTDHFHH